MSAARRTISARVRARGAPASVTVTRCGSSASTPARRTGWGSSGDSPTAPTSIAPPPRRRPARDGAPRACGRGGLLVVVPPRQLVQVASRCASRPHAVRPGEYRRCCVRAGAPRLGRGAQELLHRLAKRRGREQLREARQLISAERALSVETGWA